MKISKIYLSMAALSVCALGITSCQDYEPFSTEEVRKGGFEQNFLAQYGQYLTPGMSWDFSTSMPRTGKYENLFGTTAMTRADGDDEITDATGADLSSVVVKKEAHVDANYYPIAANTLEWMHEHLQESVNNTESARPFRMVASSEAGASFTIIPIYQGNAVMEWDLHLVCPATGTDYMIWTKGEGIQIDEKPKNSETWSGWKDLDRNSHTMAKWQNGGVDRDCKVRCLPITVMTDAFAGEEYYFQLNITKGYCVTHQNPDAATVASDYGDYAHTGDMQRSDEGMMLALECPLPDNLKAYESLLHHEGAPITSAFILGVEDASEKSSDWDINDIVFLVLSDSKPYQKKEATTSKRYLIEDLGNTYDFDFNDIVVDVTEYTTTEYKDGKAEEIGKEQTATIKHLCGTLPFQVTVGEYTFNRVSDPTDLEGTQEELAAEPEATTRVAGCEPNYTHKITGWDPELNNIVVKVWQTPDASVEGSEVFTVAFPEYAPKGEVKVPMMIAVDQTVNWMDEHQQIPNSWLYYGNFNNNWNNYVGLQYSTSGNNMKTPTAITALEGTSLTVESKGEASGDNWKRFNIGFYDPSLNLTAGVYDFSFDFECTADINLMSVKVAGGNHITSTAPDAVEKYNGPEPAFNNNGKGGKIEGTVSFTSDPETGGYTLYIIVKETSVADFTFKVSNLKLERNANFDNGNPGVGGGGEVAGGGDGLAKPRK